MLTIFVTSKNASRFKHWFKSGRSLGNWLFGLDQSSFFLEKSALPGNRTQVSRMGILNDTTTPAVLDNHQFKVVKENPKIFFQN